MNDQEVRETLPFFMGDGLEIIGDVAPLFAALAVAQSEFGELKRTATAKIQMKNGGNYTFSYAPLDEVLRCVGPSLAKNGLWFGQPLSSLNGAFRLRTIIAHKSGAMISSVIDLPRSDDVKALGSNITYLRRYSIQAILGLAAEEDDDGSGGNGDKYERTQKPQKQTAEALPPKRDSGQRPPKQEVSQAQVAALIEEYASVKTQEELDRLRQGIGTMIDSLDEESYRQLGAADAAASERAAG